jgi:hypothetical protein
LLPLSRTPEGHLAAAESEAPELCAAKGLGGATAQVVFAWGCCPVYGMGKGHSELLLSYQDGSN